MWKALTLVNVSLQSQNMWMRCGCEREIQSCHSVALQHYGSERRESKKRMGKCRCKKRGSVWLHRHRGTVVEGSEERRQVRKEGSKEGDAGALQLQQSFRCLGNRSTACVASSQQCASGSPDPVKIIIKNFKHKRTYNITYYWPLRVIDLTKQSQNFFSITLLSVKTESTAAT